jgi:hypothetical protein
VTCESGHIPVSVAEVTGWVLANHKLPSKLMRLHKVTETNYRLKTRPVRRDVLHDCNKAAMWCKSPGGSAPCERDIDVCSIWYQLTRLCKFYHILNKPQLWIIHELQSQTEHSSQLISIESCSILTTANTFLCFVCPSFECNWNRLMRYVPLEPPFSFRSICSQFAWTGRRLLHSTARTVVSARYKVQN